MVLDDKDDMWRYYVYLHHSEKDQESRRLARNMIKLGTLCIYGNARYGYNQGCRNSTKSEGASETSNSCGAKNNPSTINFYADLCSPRHDASFSV